MGGWPALLGLVLAVAGSRVAAGKALFLQPARKRRPVATLEEEAYAAFNSGTEAVTSRSSFNNTGKLPAWAAMRLPRQMAGLTLLLLLLLLAALSAGCAPRALLLHSVADQLAGQGPISTPKRHMLPRSRRPEAAGRTRIQAPGVGPAPEGTHRQAAQRTIEAQRRA